MLHTHTHTQTQYIYAGCRWSKLYWVIERSYENKIRHRKHGRNATVEKLKVESHLQN